MLIFLIIIIVVLFVDAKVTPQDKFHTDYCGIKQTSAINGIFTILIFFSHSVQYIKAEGTLDAPYLSFRTFLGQLVVVSFLFYSGFGIMESIEKRGIDYVKSIPVKRFFKVWYHFTLAFVLYLIIYIIFDYNDSLKTTLLSYIGTSDYPNSNWYIFVILVMYAIIFAAFMISQKSKLTGVAVTIVLTIAFLYFEYKIGLPERYYNTVFCLPFGMLFSLIKPYFDKFIMKNDIIWAVSFAAVFTAFYLSKCHRDDSIVIYNISAIFAAVLILLTSMKIKLGNAIIDFFGNHIFSIFVLQRIPMIILYELGFNKHKYSFIIFSLIGTICLAMIFDYFTAKTDTLIFKRRKVIDMVH